tara:strand:+ start:2121 stop:2762 length:642 start_codon:yes stop_codon:yes gene_type:complete
MPLANPDLTEFTTASQAVVSYDWFDLSAQTGFRDLYLGKTVDADVISNIAWYSNEIDTMTSVDVTDFTQKTDYDFDITFAAATTLKGAAILNISHAITVSGSTENNSYIIAKVRHWDGTTETELVANQSDTLTSSSDGQYSQANAIDLEIPETVFAVGETLRVTIEQWVKRASGGNQQAWLGHDPKNRGVSATLDWGTTPTMAVLQTPFKIDQ